MLRLQFLLWDLFIHSTFIPLDATHPEKLHSQRIDIITRFFFFFLSPKLSPLYTSPFHPLHVLGYDKCNLFWIVIFMRCLNTYVLFVVAKTTQVVISILYFLLIYIILLKTKRFISACLRIMEIVSL